MTWWGDGYFVAQPQLLLPSVINDAPFVALIPRLAFAAVNVVAAPAFTPTASSFTESLPVFFVAGLAGLAGFFAFMTLSVLRLQRLWFVSARPRVVRGTRRT